MFGFMGGNKAAKAEKAKKENATSRNRLIKFLEEFRSRTDDDYIRDGLHVLKNVVESYQPCSDEKALVLDRKLQFIVEKFKTSRFVFNNYFNSSNIDGKAMAQEYEKANREIFAMLMPILESQLARRNDLMSSDILDEKQLKKLTEHERADYYNRQKDLENIEKKWNVEGAILDFTIKYKKLGYERQILLNKHAELKNKLMTDKLNRDAIIQQLDVLDEEIERIKGHESIIAREIVNNKDMQGMLDDIDAEKFVNDHQYGDKKFLEIYNKLAKEAQEYAKNRKSKNLSIDEIKETYKENRVKAIPSESTPQKSKYLQEAEEYDAQQQAEQLRVEKGQQSTYRDADKERK